MNIKTFKQLAPVYFKAKLTPLIVGRHGIGKTELQTAIAKENGFDRVMNIKLGNLNDSADLLGLFEFKDTESGRRTVYARPDFWPKNGEKVLIFFDELNRCHKSLVQPVMEIALEFKHHDYHLPEGCRVIAAMNPDTEDYEVESFNDEAFFSRFCQIKLDPSVKEWGEYMNGTFGDTVNSHMVSFFTSKPQLLEAPTAPFKLKIKPDRRKVSKFLLDVLPQELDDELLLPIAESMLGEEVALAAVQRYVQVRSIKSNKERVDISGADIMDSLHDSEVSVYLDKIFSANDLARVSELTRSMIHDYGNEESKEDLSLTDQQCFNFIQFMNKLPNELLDSTMKLLAEDVRPKSKLGVASNRAIIIDGLIKLLSKLTK